MNWLGKVIQESVTHKDRVLSVGCGILQEIEGLKCKSFTGIDIYEPYLEYNRKRFPKWNFLLGDVTTMHIAGGSFDVVIASDILEHLHRHDALNLLKKIKLWTSRVAIVFTPSEFFDNKTITYRGVKTDVLKYINETAPYKGLGINKYQEHLSLITEEEIKAAEFVTKTFQHNEDNPSTYGVYTKC
jgi:2-polyprenyl-3-methyl-5-hydroxy-6-metoxy-1,4-benzoquinol methylase